MLTFQTAIPPNDSRLAFSPDSRYLAIAGRGPFLEVLDLTTGTILPVPEASPFALEAVWFTPDGSLYGTLWDRMFDYGKTFGARVNGPIAIRKSAGYAASRRIDATRSPRPAWALA